jgi:hypothetical protein
VIAYWPGIDYDRPSGGVKTHYDHVRILRELGYDARILHMQPGFQCTWFEHSVPIVYTTQQPFGRDDVLVLNEIMGPQTATIAPGIRKVIFAQNVHYVWRGWAVPPEIAPPYRHPDVIATLVLTDYEREHFQWAFPSHPVYVTPHGIDGRVFVPLEKKRQVAFMPRKHADEAQATIGWLAATGALEGWTVVAIDGMAQADVATTLGESLVFMAFGYPEGGTLPPFEAMAAGCVTVGYGGFASDALLRECGGVWVPTGDSCRFARTLAPILRKSTADLTTWGQALREQTLDVLSPQKERDAIAAAWSRIL